MTESLAVSAGNIQCKIMQSVAASTKKKVRKWFLHCELWCCRSIILHPYEPLVLRLFNTDCTGSYKKKGRIMRQSG